MAWICRRIGYLHLADRGPNFGEFLDRFRIQSLFDGGISIWKNSDAIKQHSSTYSARPILSNPPPPECALRGAHQYHLLTSYTPGAVSGVCGIGASERERKLLEG